VFGKEGLFPQVHNEDKTGGIRRAFDGKLQKARQQHHRHVVHTVEPGVFESGQGRAFTRTRQAGDDDDFLVVQCRNVLPGLCKRSSAAGRPVSAGAADAEQGRARIKIHRLHPG
jgi:hypothetical protein